MLVDAQELLVQRPQRLENISSHQHAVKLNVVPAPPYEPVIYLPNRRIKEILLIVENPLPGLVFEMDHSTGNVDNSGAELSDEAERSHHPGAGLLCATNQSL